MNNTRFAKKWFELNYLHQIELKQKRNQNRLTLKELN